MERGPLLAVLENMKGTDEELDIVVMGRATPIEIRNVQEVSQLQSSHGIKVTTLLNSIWIDASHVSAVRQARTDV